MQLNHLLVGQIEPLGNNGILSAILKKKSLTPLYLTKTGFLDDAQADLKNHGGLEKAVHHYHYGHYDFWRKELGDLAILRCAGAFGENLSTLKWDEKTIAVGDVFRLGEALIQVSQGRQPCSKLNIVFDHKMMAKRVQQTGLTGWYYRVLEEGVVCPNDQFILVDRLAEQWTIHKLWKILYVDKMNCLMLEAMTKLDVLSLNWRQLAQKRLSTQKIEDWSKRLDG